MRVHGSVSVCGCVAGFSVGTAGRHRRTGERAGVRTPASVQVHGGDVDVYPLLCALQPRASSRRSPCPGHSPCRRLWFRVLSRSNPPQTGRDASPATGAPAGKAPFRPPGGGNSRDVSVRHAPGPLSLAESFSLGLAQPTGSDSGASVRGKSSRGAGSGDDRQPGASCGLGAGPRWDPPCPGPRLQPLH